MTGCPPQSAGINVPPAGSWAQGRAMPMTLDYAIPSPEPAPAWPRSPTTVQSASDVGTAVDRMLDLGGDGLQLELLPAGAGLAAGPPRDRGREATHPFAEGMTTDAAVACAADDASLLRLERPGWATAPGRTLSR